MIERDPEELFAEVAVDLGILTQAQIAECRKAAEQLRAQGQQAPTIASIARERKLLVREQYEQIKEEMRRRAEHPMLAGYELLEKIGSGAMGEVYKAQQPALQRTVALKVLKPELAADKDYANRLRREAQLAAKITHPNAVQMFDVGEERGKAFLVMEYVDGPSLKQVLESGPLGEREALGITRGVARALAQAHAQNIVHRNIKPSNILLTKDRTAKLNDLGVAKYTGEDGVQTITDEGSTVGTPRYMSPEQGRAEQSIDGRSDIYSLGILLYRMLCGKEPFIGPTALSVIKQQLMEPLPDPKAQNPTISDATVRLIRDMTVKKREDRIQNCAELDARIEKILSGKGDTAAVPPPLPPGARAFQPARPATPRPAALPKRRSVALPVIISLAILLGGGVAWFAIKHAKPKAPKPEEVVEQLLAEGASAEQNAKWEEAKKYYEQARAMASDRASIDTAIKRVQTRIELKEQIKEYERLEQKALELSQQGKWEAAKEVYQEAVAAADKLPWKPDSFATLREHFDELEKELRSQAGQEKVLSQYTEHVQAGLTLVQDKKWNDAKAAYEKAKTTAAMLRQKPETFYKLDQWIVDADAAAKAEQEQAKKTEAYRQNAEQGRQLAADGKWAEAKEAYERAKAAAEKLDEMPDGYQDVTAGLAECEKQLKEQKPHPGTTGGATGAAGAAAPGGGTATPAADRARDALTARCTELLKHFNYEGDVRVEKFGNNYYACIPLLVRWGVAVELSQALGGHLVTVESADENRFLSDTVRLGQRLVWIGCSDARAEGEWLWINGKVVAFSNWGNGEPNDGNHEQHFGLMQGDPTWDDRNTWERLAFFCEWEPQQAAAAAQGTGQGRISPYAEISTRLDILEGPPYEDYLRKVKGNMIQLAGWVVKVEPGESGVVWAEVDLYSYGRGATDLKVQLPAAAGKALKPGTYATFRGTIESARRSRSTWLVIEKGAVIR